MTMQTARTIIEWWEINDFPGRVKTQQVLEAEEFIITGKPNLTYRVLINERYTRKKDYYQRNKYEKLKKDPDKLVTNHSGTNSNTTPDTINSLDTLQLVQDKHIRLVMEYVCQYYNITVQNAVSFSRKPEPVEVRKIVSYIAYNFGLGTMVEIGRNIRNKNFKAMDHATVSYFIKEMTMYRNVSAAFDKRLKQFETDLKIKLFTILK